MALQTSGAISLDDMHVELGATSGTEVSLNDVDIRGLIDKASGAQSSFSEWYGAANRFTLTLSSNTQEADVRALAVTAGWDETLGLDVVVDTGIYVWSDDVTKGGLIVAGSFPSGITILNKGYIMGKGGYGGFPQGPLNTPAGNPGGDGGPALQITSSSTVDITNNSGAYIAGGGGGGGTGNGGGGYGAGYSGTPGSSSYPAYASGSPSNIYCPNNGGSYGTVSGTGGQHGQAGGGSGGWGTWTASGCSGYSVPLYGGQGGRVLPGLGGGDGGGSGGAASGNGGGNWGAAGAGTNAGSGGAAITGTYNSYTDNGTTYGAT